MRWHHLAPAHAIGIGARPAVLALLLSCIAGAAGILEAQPRPERFTSWTAPVFPVAEYRARRSALLEQLQNDEILLLPSGEGTSGGETFRQLDDFEYLAGLEIPRSILAIDGRTQRALLFVPRMDPRFDNVGRPNDFPGRPLADDPALRALSGVEVVQPDSALDAFLRDAATRGTRVLVNSGRLAGTVTPPLSRFGAPTPGEGLAAELQRSHPGLVLGNAYRQVATVRMVKSAREISLMREAARVTMVAIARGAARVRPGVDERTLTGAFSADCMTLGAQRDAFTPIIKSGDNSLWPWRILGAHYDRRNRVMLNGELVIFDVGCEREHYVSDVGRTFPVGAQFEPRQRALVEMIRGISDAVIAAARPGITLSELQRVATTAIPEAARPFMQAPLYFGHHLGLDTGDPSLADAMLAPGMIFTIEPWYYNHVENVAAFLEDEILITAQGSENLTAALPRDADGLERLRAGGDTTWLSTDAMRGRTRDGVLQFTLDRATGTVHAYDLLNGAVLATTPTCALPQSGALTPDDVSFVVRCTGGDRTLHVNTASFAVSPAPRRRVPASQPVATVGRKNEVVLVGMIHGAHRTSTRYGTAVLRRLLEAMRPDFVLTEIPPNRLDDAQREFAATGQIVEPRVVRFPEYVDVLFPMTRSMRFTIIPTAGWSRPMDAFRTAALRRIEGDSSRRAEWMEYAAANRRADSVVTLRGADDPYFINSAEYDSIQAEAHEPYNRLFNAELGPGGWDNINEAHVANIARALDAHRGKGRRFVITYGAGHIEWFRRALQRRDDITLLDVAPFLERIGAARVP